MNHTTTILARSLAIACTLACSGTLATVCLTPAGCSTAPKTAEGRKELGARVEETIKLAKEKNPRIAKHLKDAYAYVVIPTVAKGAILVGGAHGQGQVFEKGKLVGYCDVSQGSIGAQIGGQAFSEFIFFEDKAAFQQLLAGEFAFAANASAVGGDAGAGTTNDYTNGVAVFVTGQEGLMLEAAIGGQQFNYTPLAAFENSK